MYPPPFLEGGYKRVHSVKVCVEDMQYKTCVILYTSIIFPSNRRGISKYVNLIVINVHGNILTDITNILLLSFELFQ